MAQGKRREMNFFRKTTIIKVRDIVGSEFCVTRWDGESVFEAAQLALRVHHDVIFYFGGVTHLTPAFMNAAIGQLYGEFSQEELRKRMAWTELDSDDTELIDRVIETAIRYYA